jgi:hypothetical protein
MRQNATLHLTFPLLKSISMLWPSQDPFSMYVKKMFGWLSSGTPVRCAKCNDMNQQQGCALATQVLTITRVA